MKTAGHEVPAESGAGRDSKRWIRDSREVQIREEEPPVKLQTA